MILHGIAGDIEAARDIGGGVSRDDLVANLPLTRGQTVRDKQHADQLITACRLDGDGNLIFVTTQQLARLENGPLAVGITQPGPETARQGAAGTDSHDLHHHHEPAWRDLIKPFSPFLAGCSQRPKFAAWTDDNDGWVSARDRAACLGAHRQPSCVGNGRRDRREEICLTVVEVGPGAYHARPAPARPVSQEDDAKLLVNTQRPPNVVDPDAPVAITIRQVRQLGSSRLAKRQGREGVGLVRGVFGLGQPRLVLRWDARVAAGHGADHQSFRVNCRPTGEVGSDLGLDQTDCRGVQVTDAKSRSGQRCDISAGSIGPLVPHTGIVSPFDFGSIPRILGFTRSRSAT